MTPVMSHHSSRRKGSDVGSMTVRQITAHALHGKRALALSTAAPRAWRIRHRRPERLRRLRGHERGNRNARDQEADRRRPAGGDPEFRPVQGRVHRQHDLSAAPPAVRPGDRQWRRYRHGQASDARYDARHPDVEADPAPDVLVVEFADTGIRIRIRWWIKPPRRADALDLQDKALERVKAALTAQGIAPPSRLARCCCTTRPKRPMATAGPGARAGRPETATCRSLPAWCGQCGT